MIEEIIQREWDFFQEVHNIGGRARLLLPALFAAVGPIVSSPGKSFTRVSASAA